MCATNYGSLELSREEWIILQMGALTMIELPRL